MIEPNFNNPNTSITRPTTIARAATLAAIKKAAEAGK